MISTPQRTSERIPGPWPNCWRRPTAWKLSWVQMLTTWHRWDGLQNSLVGVWGKQPVNNCVPSFHNSSYGVQVECCYVLGAVLTLECFYILGKWGRDSGCRMLWKCNPYLSLLGRLRGCWMTLTSKPKSQGKNLRICALTCSSESQDLCSRLWAARRWTWYV